MVETGVNKGWKYSVGHRTLQVENLPEGRRPDAVEGPTVCGELWAEPGRATGVWVSEQLSSG